MIRILLVDDQALLRTGFRMILDAEPELAVVDEAGNGVQAVELAETLHPDVVLKDIRMPEMDGVEATRRITEQPDSPRVVVLTTFDLDEYVYASLHAGASAFLLKDAKEDQLLAAVRITAQGGSLFAPAVTARLIERFCEGGGVVPDASSRVGRARLDVLTARERDVLLLLAHGLSNAEISTRLVVSEHTTKTHVASVLQKLSVRSRVQAVVLAYESGLVRPGT